MNRMLEGSLGTTLNGSEHNHIHFICSINDNTNITLRNKKNTNIKLYNSTPNDETINAFIVIKEL